MSQFDFGDLESPLSGTNFVNSNLEPWRDSLNSLHSGSSRPSYAVAGMLWINNTTNPWVVNVFDGTDDISLGTVNTSTNIFTPSNTIQVSDNNTFTGNNTFQGDVVLNDVSAETTAGFNLKDSNGNTCLSGGAGGAANLTMGGNMSGASTHKLVNMIDPTDAQDYATKNYVDNKLAGFISAEQSITVGGSLTIAHGLSSTPYDIIGWLVCKTAEGGYSVNDPYPLSTGQFITAAATNSMGFSCVPDATNLNIRYGSFASSAFSIMNKATGGVFNITPANWRLVVRARV